MLASSSVPECEAAPSKQDSSGYIIEKCAASGKKNKHHVHRVFSYLANPGSVGSLTVDMVLAHRCGRGRHDAEYLGFDLACVNPYRLAAVD